jgi:hypothetical protein
MAALALFVTQPPASASEWALRAERAFPEPAQASLKNISRVYALLFQKDFAGALPLLREMYAAWNISDRNAGLPVLLAWCYVETGRPQDAVPLLAMNPAPDPSGLSPFVSLHFPRLLYLRGVIDERQRKQQFELFLKLSGPDPLMWGEEARARGGGR